MTSLHLSLWIVGGILLQLAVYLSFGFWRHWLNYLSLRSGATEIRLAAEPLTSDDEPEPATAAWSGLRSFRVERKVVEDAAQSTCSIYLVPQDGLPLAPFRPGQFLTFHLALPGASGTGESTIRCYSLSDAPGPSGYRVSIKRVLPPTGSQLPAGRASNFFHDRIEVGSLLQVRAPAGHFCLDRSDAPVVLIGAGIGITPLLSMLKSCLTEQPGRELWLFYGVRNSSELVLKSDLQALAAAAPNFQLMICFSAPLPQDQIGRDYRHCGRVDVDLLRRQLPLKPYHFYICGPTAMLETLVPALEDWGVPDGRIHYEAFGPASIPRRNSTLPAAAAKPHEDEAVGVVVSFARSGKQVPGPAAGSTLLDLAEAHGVTVSSGCRAGGCGSCQTSILAGEVAYRQTPDFDPEPGTCLLCVCTPKSNLTLEL